MKRLTISFFLFIFFVLIILAAQSLFAQSPVNPSDNATSVSQTLSTISWTDFDDGNGNGPYDAELDDDPTFSSPDFSISNTNSTFWDVSGFNFEFNTTYYWRVRDTDTSGFGDDGPWHTYNFTIELATPSLTSPSGSFTYTTPVNFTWTMLGNYSNVDFTVTVASDPGFTQDVQTSTVSGVLNTSIAIPKAGQYYWKVDAVVTSGPNSGESTTSSTGTFTMTLPGPALLSPVNGLTGVSVLPTLVWGAVTGAVSYKLYVDTSSSFSSPIYSDNQGTNTSKTFDATISNFPLTNEAKYYWKVSAIDNDGNEYFSSTSHFTVTQGFTVDQHTPSTGQYIQSTSVILGWSLGRSAAGYTFVVQYMDATSAPTTETDWSSASSVNVTGSSNSSYSTTISVTLGKTYYWRVLIKRTSTDEYVHYPSPTTYNYFYTEGGLTVTLTPNWPKDSVYVYTNTPRLDWIVNGYTGDLTYQVQYRRTTGPGAPSSWTQTADTLTNLYYAIPSDLWPGQIYEWQVRAKYGSNYTSWSDPAYFICYGPGTLEVPTPNYPAGGVTVYTNTPRLDWILTTNGTGLKYQVRYSTSNSVDGNGMLNGPDATSYPANYGDLSSNKYLTLPSLTPGTTYYWQVRSYSSIVDGFDNSVIDGSSDAFSSWSSVTSFVNNGPGTLVVPTPNWPIGGITVYTTSPQLSWYLNPYSTGLTYDIDYSDGGTPDGTPDVTGVSSQYYQLTGLTPGNTISWRVRSKNSLGQTSAWSSTETFVIAGGSLSYAVANWPKDGITVYNNRPELSWYLEGSTLGITGYEVKYKKTSAPANWLTYNPSTNDADGGKYTVSGVFNMKKTIDVDLTYGATYYWAVYPIGATSFNTAGEQYFVVVGGPGTTTISLNWPYDGITVYSTTVTLSWIVIGSEAGITEYELVYSQSDVFNPSVTTTVTGITQKSYTVSGLTAGATYYWKVRAKYADGSYTNYSSVYSFTIQEGSALIVQPFVGSPHNVIVPTTSATFSWILPVPPAPDLKYELEYSTSPNFVNANRIENISTQFVTVSELQPNTRYYWRVRSKANDGTYSYFSNTGKFGVELTTGVEDQTNIPSNYDLKQNYPNPFNPNTKIVFDLPENTKVTLHIYSLLGELVATIIENEELPAGRYERMFDASKLTSGVYFYQIITEKFTSTKKMVLIK